MSSLNGTRRPSALVRIRSATSQVTIVPRDERLVGVGGQVGLDAEHLHLGPAGLDRGRHAGAEPAAADRDQHHLDVGQVLEDLEADGALAGDDVAMVVGRDQRQAPRRRPSLRPHAPARLGGTMTISAPMSRTAAILISGPSRG